MGVLIVAGLLLVAAGIWWFLRVTEPPIVRQRVNAGSDRHFAGRDRASSDSSESGGLWDGDDGGDDD
jgi:hypothetical protein